MKCKTFALLLPVILLMVAPAWAQFDTAAVLGTVRDTSGAVVPDATVTLTSTATGLTVKRLTSAAGDYEFPTVSVGTYLVTAEKAGFAVALVENVRAQVGARLRVDLQMTVGEITEQVQVQASAPLLETDSSQRGQVITGQQTVALPLNGREYSSLMLLTNGVRPSPLRLGATPREGAFNVNGLRSTFNNFLIDGVDNNAYGTSNQGFSNQVMQPPPDAISEFKVVTNNQSAEYGRAAGATVNVVYKSGANQFHGSGWEFFRDDALNAMGFFKPADGRKPPLRRNQYGGVLGGPILMNRAFFFGDFEGFRETRSLPAFATVADMRQRQGIVAVDVRDPRTGVVYPAGTAVPMTVFARKVLEGLPTTNLTGPSNYTTLQNFTNDTDKAGGKVDVNFTDALRAFGRYGWRTLETFDQPVLPLPSGGSGNGTIYARNRQLVAGMTWVTSPTSLLEARFGWSTTEGGKNPPALGSVGALEEYGLTGLPADARINGGLPTTLITGYSDLGRQATNPQWQYPTVYNPKVNYIRSLGRHSLKTGYEFQRIETEVQDVNPLYGRDAYSGQFTRPAGAAANNLYNLADFMLGLRSQYAISTLLVANLRQHMHFLYVQDDYRASDRLTLNLGLRYEYATPQWERDNLLTNWDPVAQEMVQARSGSLRDRALINPDRNNLAPRLGLAYTMTPGTVLRGGWGVSYVHFHRAGGGNLLPINAPQVINAVVNQTAADWTAGTGRTTEQGYPADLAAPTRFNPLIANITYMPEDYRSSQVQSWFASVQRELGRGMLFDAAYVGNRATGLLLFANYNQATPQASATGTASIAARRPIATWGDITYAFNGGRSEYHGLQLKYEWRMNADLTLLSTLTLSKAKDNGAGSLETAGGDGNFPAPQDFRNLDAEWSTSAYDQPYNSTTSFVWRLPFGRNRSGLAGGLLGGWTVSGINTVSAGWPVTFTYTPAAAFQVSGIAQDFRGANNYRANVSGDSLAPADQRTYLNWFNKANVTIPTDPSQPFGNAERNGVRGPNFWQVDLAVSKHVGLAGRSELELRLEAFNLFDRVNFLNPNGNRSSAAFGTITGTFPARQLQLGARVTW
ncbi:MAG: carboxypeptidase regulatory-like domain-containing protein [Vicinamibacterales bacterium]